MICEIDDKKKGEKKRNCPKLWTLRFCKMNDEK